MTHRAAVRRVVNHLRVTRGCPVVMAERVTMATSEQPDAIGWKGSSGASVLVEVKVSRADFHADKDKSFRRVEEQGVGDFRYFAAPHGILTPEDMPAGWGLLEIHENHVRERKSAERKFANKQAEVGMLVSAIRRLELSATMFVQHESAPTVNNDSVQKIEGDSDNKSFAVQPGGTTESK